jgi:NADPH-dependent curcumin reductase CurA
LTELPATVTAAYITATGPAEDIRLGELPMPPLGPTDIGSAVVQLAATAGARVLATASPRDVDWCHSSGAEQVFDYGNPDLEARLAAAAPDGVDVYLDTSGHHNFDAIMPVLGHGPE